MSYFAYRASVKGCTRVKEERKKKESVKTKEEGRQQSSVAGEKEEENDAGLTTDVSNEEVSKIQETLMSP